MVQVASASPVVLRPVVLSPRVPVRTPASDGSHQSRVVPFPVAFASEDQNWQSVGQAAFNVLRNLRPMPASSQNE